MKASELIKKERTIESLYEEIKFANERGEYCMVCEPFVYISSNTVARLLADGFKCMYIKDHLGLERLIIEW